MINLTFSETSKILRLERETGKLFWLPRPSDMFGVGNIGADANAKTWNKKFAGKEAFTAIGNSGYHIGRIFRRGYLAHRVIWLLHTGAWPSNQIDHINGDRKDNRVANLRVVTSAENARNQKRKTSNTSGACGVSWKQRERKWEARIRVSGRDVFLGYFDQLSLAIAARAKANIEYGFSTRHGGVA